MKIDVVFTWVYNFNAIINYKNIKTFTIKAFLQNVIFYNSINLSTTATLLIKISLKFTKKLQLKNTSRNVFYKIMIRVVS